MRVRNVAICALISFALGAVATRYLAPPVIKTETVEVETVRTDVHTITRVLERPDGTRETIIDSTDRSKLKTSRSDTASAPVQKNWLVSAGARLQPQNLQTYYALTVHRRVLGPFSAGLGADTSGRVELSVGMEF